MGEVRNDQARGCYREGARVTGETKIKRSSGLKAKLGSIMNDLFDSPPLNSKLALRQHRQQLSDVVDECKAQAYSTQDAVTFSNDTARLLVDLAERNLPHRPLSNSGKYIREVVIWRWHRWRQDQVDNKRLPRKTATIQAVEGAVAEINGLKKIWGSQITLKETTVKDRVCRKTKAPRPLFWWEKE